MATDRLGGCTHVECHKTGRGGYARWIASHVGFDAVCGVNKSRRLAYRDLAAMLGREVIRQQDRIDELEEALRDISKTVYCATNGHE